jgi:hypothetical protein
MIGTMISHYKIVERQYNRKGAKNAKKKIRNI